jgi:predicted outer membrane protein
MRQLHIPATLVLMLLATALTGCDRADTRDDDVAVAAAATVEDAATTTELLSPLRAAAIAVVETSQLHAARTTHAEVQRYAQTVAVDHRAVITALDSIAGTRGATLHETSAARAVSNTVRMAHAGLDTAPPADADLPFIRAQVESHRRVLETIDGDLSARARSQDMQMLLGDVRAMVDAHLIRARQILGSLLGEPVEPPPAGIQTPPSPQVPPPTAPPVAPPDTIPGT